MSSLRKTILMPLCCLLLLPSACGGGEEAAPELQISENATRKLDALDEDKRGEYTAVLKLQEDALSSTADVVARAASAGRDEIEDAMQVLNTAILKARGQIGALRNEGKGKRGLVKELRDRNNRLSDAFTELQKHHPDPAAVMEVLGIDADS